MQVQRHAKSASVLQMRQCMAHLTNSRLVKSLGQWRANAMVSGKASSTESQWRRTQEQEKLEAERLAMEKLKSVRHNASIQQLVCIISRMLKNAIGSLIETWKKSRENASQAAVKDHLRALEDESASHSKTAALRQLTLILTRLIKGETAYRALTWRENAKEAKANQENMSLILECKSAAMRSLNGILRSLLRSGVLTTNH